MKTISSKLSLEGQLRLHSMQILVGEEDQARYSAQEVTSQNRWQEVLDLLRQWKLLSGLEARIAELDIPLPDMQRGELSLRAQPAFVQTMLCVRAGVSALTALERAGICCAGFKGLAALAYLYPSLRNRTLQDVDVLISTQDVETALTVLEETGFQRSPNVPWDEYVAFLRNSPGTAGNEAVSLRDEKGGAVDLHWRLGGLDIESLLASRGSRKVVNRSLPLMSAGHSMLLSVHHALRNDFVPGDIARDVCDFAHWQKLLSETGQWSALRADAERWGLSAACAALAWIVAELRDVPEEDLLLLNEADRKVARQLSDFYFHQLLFGPVNTDLAYVASTQPLMQVLAGLVGNWKGYRDLMRRSEAANGEVSLSLIQRLSNVAKAASDLSPSGWKQVRALARTKNKMATPRRPSQN